MEMENMSICIDCRDADELCSLIVSPDRVAFLRKITTKGTFNKSRDVLSEALLKWSKIPLSYPIDATLENVISCRSRLSSI